ncbi:UbiA-like polyprenyltransferase [Leptospira ilyithenensis]|uniref:4-hydroxybenzoate polyprenyltransferase n=1 Tax=Leptospira ilyithenensis TaxID=2484901 RepID=A0A4R9LVY3_9LEPT|nr:UbiA-like polyprenyltransferase [Leptospira ilyithenensis]TGN16774.1 4-hydroxybenzoate octaprenyltransferase [Leptospira ilyithenensis]
MNIFKNIILYGQMVKLSHTLFALPFAGISFILAYLQSPLETVDLIRIGLLIVICMVSARSAAMGFNRYVDAEIDERNPRTEKREIPSGKISKLSALLFIGLSAFIFIFSSFFINKLAFLLSFPALFVLFLYSLTKRFTLFCHLVLGLAISLAPLGAWIAMTESIDTIPILFSLGLLFHISAFDILYAIQDADFDAKEGLHSIPSQFGEKKSRIIAVILHVLSLFGFSFAGRFAELGILYYLVLSIIAFLLFYEHRLSWNHRSKELPPRFYQINSWISVVLFFAILIDKWSEFLIKLSSGISFK